MTESMEKADDERPIEADAAGEQASETPDAAEQSEVESASLEDQLAAASDERDQLRDLLARAQADMENLRKRAQKEAAEVRKYAAIGLVRDLLPGLDNLQRGIEAAQSTNNIDELVQGVSMVMTQFEQVLGQHSVMPIKSVGEPFDPNVHEALQQVPSDEHPANTVAMELQRGFICHDRVVRPSKVIVSSGPAATDSEDG